MTLAKIEFTPLDKEGAPVTGSSFEVLFNPNSYSISKAVTWSSVSATGAIQNSENASGQTPGRGNAPTLRFGGGGSRSLSLDLFYDVTESATTSDVREETNKVVELTRIDRDLQRPPVVAISWGAAPPANSDFPFIGVVSNLTQRFTLFSSDGRPLRATLTITMIEFLDPELDKRQYDPEFTTRRVKRGDTLSGIAAEVYRDPGLWRVIAEANHLDDPRYLAVGRTLAIPKRG